jgi:hypothetical protein
MTLVESLLHHEMLLALFLFAVISVVVELLGYRVLLTVSEVAASSWAMEHAVIPAARALALVIFILTAYPVLFGVDTAVPVGELLAIDRMRLTTLVNIIFLLSLLLPLLPLLSRMPALVLPIQGIAAATMLFRWWADTQTITNIVFWPGLTIVAALAGLAFLTHEIAKFLAHHLEKILDAKLHRTGTGRLIYRTVIMVSQVPVILLYTLSLGRQLQ